MLTLNQEVLALLAEPHDLRRVASANRYLAAVNEQAHTWALYVIDRNGTTLAASNWQQPHSFVGSNYSFRPYFQQAIHGHPGSFYAIGNTSHTPGYFLSWPIRDGAAPDSPVIGVAAVKVSLDALENAWSKGSEQVLVSDENGVVILSANPAWKFALWQALPGPVRDRIAMTRQYEGGPLQLLPPLIDAAHGKRAWLAPFGHPPLLGGRYVRLDHVLPQTGWTLTLLVDMQPRNRTLAAVLASLLAAYAALLAGWHYVRLRRRRAREQQAVRRALQQARDDLERKVHERTRELECSNEQLSVEIRERINTENSLRATRSQLAEASKLAAMGQMAAGVAHEINQPLAALRTFADNARTLLERDRRDAVHANLGQITQLVERIAHTTQELKSFARRHRGPMGRADPFAALQDSLGLLGPALRAAGIALRVEPPERRVLVNCDATGLEQVFTNLIGNAMDALRGRPDALLVIRLHLPRRGLLEVSVRDNGPGIGAQDLPHLFEPFYTTKPRGHGLGLGLSIVEDIVEQSGGHISVDNLQEGGACFLIHWPCEETDEQR